MRTSSTGPIGKPTIFGKLPGPASHRQQHWHLLRLIANGLRRKAKAKTSVNNPEAGRTTTYTEKGA